MESIKLKLSPRSANLQVIVIHRKNPSEKRKHEASERDFLIASMYKIHPLIKTSSLIALGPTERSKNTIYESKLVYYKRWNNLCSIVWYLVFSPVSFVGFCYYMSSDQYMTYAVPNVCTATEQVSVCSCSAHMFLTAVAFVMLNELCLNT